METQIKNYEENKKISRLFQLSFNLNSEQLKREIKLMKISPQNVNEISFLSFVAKATMNIQADNIHSLSREYEKYKNILKSYSKLFDDLNLKNSLELCCLYSYLLWNGYFSVNNSYNYSSKNLLSLIGVYPFDIMNGNGICINNSSMLRDFLNIKGFKSAVLANNIDKKMQIDYRPMIERGNLQPNILSQTKEFLRTPITRRTGDHAFNLICDNNCMYIFDSTNFLLLNIESIYNSKLINGNGNFSLKPHYSYAMNFPNESREALNKFYNSKFIYNNYTKESFKSIFENIIDLLEDNKDLTNKYYRQNEESIIEISESVNKMKKKIKS